MTARSRRTGAVAHARSAGQEGSRKLLAVVPGAAFGVPGEPRAGYRHVRWETDLASGDLVAVVETSNGDRERIPVHEYLPMCQEGVPTEPRGASTDFGMDHRFPFLTEHERYLLRAKVEELLEALHGDRRGTVGGPRPGHQPRAEYDPVRTTQGQRVDAKVKELQERPSPGWGSPSRATIYRSLKALVTQGVEGLIRADRLRSLDTLSAVDPTIRIVADATVKQLQAPHRSSWSKKNQRALFMANLEAAGADVSALPRAALHQVLEVASAGAGLDLPAQTRLSQASRPSGRSGTYHSTRPGDLCQFDVWRLDAFLWSPLAPAMSADVITLIDTYDRRVLVCMVVPHPCTARDLATALFRALRVPEYAEGSVPGPGWTGVPERIAIPEDLPAANTNGTVRPRRIDTITMDHGSDFDSVLLSGVAAKMGISLIVAAPARGNQKGVVEAWHNCLAQVVQTFPGAKGARVQYRGRHVEEHALFTFEEAERALRAYIEHDYHRSPHDGLRDPADLKRRVSPNEMFELYLARGGAPLLLPEPSSVFDFLPTKRVRAKANGVHLNDALYDGVPLDGWRDNERGTSGPDLRVAWDPYDRGRLYVQMPDTHQWYCLRAKQFHPKSIMPLAASRYGAARASGPSGTTMSAAEARAAGISLLRDRQAEAEAAKDRKRHAQAIAYERLVLAGRDAQDLGMAYLAPELRDRVLEPVFEDPNPGWHAAADDSDIPLAASDLSWWDS